MNKVMHFLQAHLLFFLSISPIMKLLGRMIDNKGIQVLFMQLKPQEEMTAVSSHHMWMEEMV